MFTCFPVPVLHAGYLRYLIYSLQFVQFVEDCVRLLECSPASCLAPRNHSQEKREKFITHRIKNKSPLTNAGTASNFEKPARAYFFSFGRMKNSFSQEKTSMFERNTIVSHLPA